MLGQYRYRSIINRIKPYNIIYDILFAIFSITVLTPQIIFSVQEYICKRNATKGMGFTSHYPCRHRQHKSKGIHFLRRKVLVQPVLEHNHVCVEIILSDCQLFNRQSDTRSCPKPSPHKGRLDSRIQTQDRLAVQSLGSLSCSRIFLRYDSSSIPTPILRCKLV